MIRFRQLVYKLFKGKRKDEPWLAYYSRKDRSIKFTDKSIYNYLKDEVGKDLDYYALNYFGTRITYDEMFRKIDSIAASLKYYGIKEKDVVTICLPNTPEAVETFYATNKIGAVADMVHPLSASTELEIYLNESKSKVLVLYDANYTKYKDVIERTNVEKVVIVSVSESMPKSLSLGYKLTKGLKIQKPKYEGKYVSWQTFLLRGLMIDKTTLSYPVKSKDLALILHSGGTTGVPKGIMISNYNFNAEILQDGVNVINVRPKDKIMTILPVFHGFGLGVCVHCPLCLRVEVILIPEFDAKRFHKIIMKYKPNIIAGVPTLWEAMLSNPRFNNVNLKDLKYVISGGDTLPLAMEKNMNDFLRTHGASISISKGYGMTESVAATAYTFDGTNEPGSIGIPMVGNKFCICEPETTKELPLGEEGEICVCGPTVMMGYLNNKEETDKVLRKHKDGNIWLHTGDIGYIALNGVIYFTQRLKRVIISSGFNIYPSSIEEVIQKHPDVKRCCVIGVPHPYKMNVAKVFVELKEGVTPSSKITTQLKKLCKENLALYSQPADYEYRDTLPKTLYNKLDYKLLEKEELEKIKESK